jgi:hypothetical protein
MLWQLPGRKHLICSNPTSRCQSPSNPINSFALRPVLVFRTDLEWKFRGLVHETPKWPGTRFIHGLFWFALPDRVIPTGHRRSYQAWPKREPHELRIPAITIIRIEKPFAARRTYGKNIKRARCQWSRHGTVEVHPVNANRRSTHRPPRRD